MVGRLIGVPEVKKSKCEAQGGATASHFFRGRGQLDDLIFRGLADDVC